MEMLDGGVQLRVRLRARGGFASEHRMLISEIFHSLQGEGELTGVPSVFIRTSGCNLRCAWCDTPYASWNPEGEARSVPALLEAVAAYPATRHVVLTGGEPMIARDLAELAAGIRATGRHVTIETAATIPPAGIACDLASRRGDGEGPRNRHLRPHGVDEVAQRGRQVVPRDGHRLHDETRVQEAHPVRPEVARLRD